MIEAMKYMYQLLLTEPHAPTLCERLERIAREAIAELESQEPVAWPCLIAEADFEQNTITLEMQCSDYKVSAGKHWLTTHPPQRTWVGLTEEELRIAFGKLYPSDIGILELAENNRDYAVEAIGARHHWTAFKAGARAGEAKLKELNT